MQNQLNKLQLINLNEMPAAWTWLEPDLKSNDFIWQHCSTQSYHLPSYLPKKDSVARFLSANKSIQFAQKQPSLLISHGPRITYYGSKLATLRQCKLPHLALSFTFTNLPNGLQRRLMSKFYNQVDRFVTYSTMEKKLYSDYFDLDESKFDMTHWSVHAPAKEEMGPALEPGQYICAIGSQGRDYKVLFKAMERLKHIKLVVVVQPENIKGLKVPENVKVYTNIPLSDCNNIVHYSQFMVLPLLHDKVPCGHSSLVSAMFHSKAILITDAITVHDYIQQDITGRFFAHQDDHALMLEIENLWNSPSDIERLAQNGYQFAHDHCTEKNVVNYFNNYLHHSSQNTDLLSLSY